MNAREWLVREEPALPGIGVVGAPISKASISPSQAWSTPPALRAALARFPTWNAQHRIDLAELSVRDFGDVLGDRDDPDATAAHQRIYEACAQAAAVSGTLVVIGGDNSLTVPAMRAAMHNRPDGGWGLITLDAHHDCRPLDQGPRNGTPVRELIEAGLPGGRIAQIGINPLGNAREHSSWAAQQGVHVFPVHEVRDAGIHAVVDDALAALRRAGVTSVYVDFDIDCVERAFAPACPASLPGGLMPVELMHAARLLGGEPRVLAADITEVDAAADVAETTIRLAAAVFLSFCTGLATRPQMAER